MSNDVERRKGNMKTNELEKEIEKNYKKEYQKIVKESYEENPGCTYNLIYMMIFRNW